MGLLIWKWPIVSKLNGYFGNQAIKILLPDKIQKAADLLGKLGYQKQVDEFILSMTRDVCAGVCRAWQKINAVKVPIPGIRGAEGQAKGANPNWRLNAREPLGLPTW